MGGAKVERGMHGSFQAPSIGTAANVNVSECTEEAEGEDDDASNQDDPRYRSLLHSLNSEAAKPTNRSREQRVQKLGGVTGILHGLIAPDDGRHTCLL